MLEKIKEFITKLNTAGIPIPALKDPKNGPSVSLTLLFLSSLYVQVGLIGKFTKLLEGVDIQSAINWFLICAGLYFARNVTSSKTGVNIDNSTIKQEGNDEKS